jgi:hypothetical protein
MQLLPHRKITAFHYKDQSVIAVKEVIAVYCGNSKKHINTLLWTFLMFKYAVHIVTIVV